MFEDKVPGAQRGCLASRQRLTGSSLPSSICVSLSTAAPCIQVDISETKKASESFCELLVRIHQGAAGNPEVLINKAGPRADLKDRSGKMGRPVVTVDFRNSQQQGLVPICTGMELGTDAK